MVSSALDPSVVAEERRLDEQIKRQEEQIAKDGKAFKDDNERQAALRFQEQCHLMLKWEEFTSANPRRSTGDSYKNFVTIDHDAPFDFINRLFHKGKDADILFNLNSSQLSLLVPQVRIFKIFVDPVTKEEFPFELPFDDSFSPHEIANITKTRSGRGRGAGLKSFTWKTRGDMPANSFQFEANMVLTFQSVEDIFATRDTREVQFASNKKTVSLAFSDLLIPQAQFKKGAKDGPRVWDPTYFKLKAVVGWKVLAPRGTNSFIKPEVRDVLSRTQNAFILAMFQHEMDVRDDGSVELNISFMTMPEMLASDPQRANILFPSPETKLEIERLVDTINRLEFEIETNRDVGNLRDEENAQSLATGLEGQSVEQLPNGAPGSLTLAAREAKIAKILEAQKRLALFDNSKKTQSYRRILSSLLTQDKLFYTLVKKDFLDKRIEKKEGSEEESFENEIIEQIAEKNEKSDGGIGGANEQLKQFVNAIEDGSNIEQFKAATTALSRLNEQEPDKSHYKVVYFYFGDLIDVVLNGMFKTSLSKPDTFENKEVKVMLGPLTFYDYGNLIDHGMVGKDAGLRNDLAETDKIYTGKLSSVSLADIPISMRVFTRWFNDTIVNEGIENFTFHEFITKAINDLIIEAVKTECYDFAPRQTQVKVTYKTFNVTENTKRTELFRNSTRVQLRDLEDTPFITEEHNALSDKKKLENYILIHASVDHPWTLAGDYDADNKNGIFHLFFGNERGIVKNIKFKRVDKPYVRAANIANNYNSSQGPTKVLREAYNADVSMYGNNLFEVGSLVRIIPSLGGSGNASELIKIVDNIGIGGYYMVLGRKDTVEAGLYKTDLDVVWMSPANKASSGKLAIGDVSNPASVVLVKNRINSVKKTADDPSKEREIERNKLEANVEGTSLGAVRAFVASKSRTGGGL